MAGVEFGERRFARRRGEEGVVVADEEIAAVGERAQRLRSLPGRRCEVVGGTAVAGRQRGVEDRPIAGAAAEIAGERVTGAGVGRGLALVVEREQAHHDAGRAEAALGAWKSDHRLLDRMETGAFGKVLDRQHLGAVDLAEQQDAGVDRLIGRRAVGPAARQDNGAGAAIAFAATLFRALGADVLSQPVEERRAWREMVKRDSLAAEAEGQTFAGPAPVTLAVIRASIRLRAHHGFFCAATEAASFVARASSGYRARQARSTADTAARSRARPTAASANRRATPSAAPMTSRARNTGSATSAFASAATTPDSIARSSVAKRAAKSWWCPESRRRGASLPPRAG